MSDTEGSVTWTSAEVGAGFGSYTDQDEFFHGSGPEGDDLTETWYWGFNLPEHALNCYMYCWVHPNLDVVSAGLILYRGITRHHLASELADYPAFMKASRVVGDGSDIALPNGLRIRVVAPLRHITVTYNDRVRETAIDVDLHAMCEPIMRANSLHFEQIMYATGEVKVRGERLSVDCHAVRDRSWGELRPEGHNRFGPYNWVTGVAEDGTSAFNLGSIHEPLPDGVDSFRDGWLWQGDKPLRLGSAENTIERETVTGRPTAFRLNLTAEDGTALPVRGEVRASVPFCGWPNMVCHLGLVEWTSGGKTAWGETMDCQWNDSVRAYSRAGHPR
jgi:hypothetical protein